MKVDDLWNLPLVEYIEKRWERMPGVLRGMAAAYADCRTGIEAIWAKQYYQRLIEEDASSNWERLLERMQVLFGSMARITMRAPGDWGVWFHHVEVKHDNLLGSFGGNGSTLGAAVRDLWARITELSDEEYLVIDAMSDTRRALRYHANTGDFLPIQERK
jgi:hypothetical protein